MAITKAKKVELLSSFKNDVKDAQSIVFVHFEKLSAKDTIILRRALRTEGVGYKVIKKSLAQRVFNDLGVSGDMPELPGETAFAYATDLLAPARGVHAFAKTHKEQVSISGGIFEGVYKSAGDMMSIALIPPREVLLSQLAYLLKSPMQRIAIAVSEVAKTKTV